MVVREVGMATKPFGRALILRLMACTDVELVAILLKVQPEVVTKLVTASDLGIAMGKRVASIQYEYYRKRGVRP